MTIAELMAAQALDPLRIGLVIGLVITMFRTRAVTGTLLPLACGVGFIAAILPVTTGAGSGVPFLAAFGAGLVVTAAMAAVAVAAGFAIRNFRR